MLESPIVLFPTLKRTHEGLTKRFPYNHLLANDNNKSPQKFHLFSTASLSSDKHKKSPIRRKKPEKNNSTTRYVVVVVVVVGYLGKGCWPFLSLFLSRDKTINLFQL